MGSFLLSSVDGRVDDPSSDCSLPPILAADRGGRPRPVDVSGGKVLLRGSGV